jgi:hypothetical protein
MLMEEVDRIEEMDNARLKLSELEKASALTAAQQRMVHLAAEKEAERVAAAEERRIREMSEAYEREMEAAAAAVRRDVAAAYEADIIHNEAKMTIMGAQLARANQRHVGSQAAPLATSIDVQTAPTTMEVSVLTLPTVEERGTVTTPRPESAPVPKHDIEPLLVKKTAEAVTSPLSVSEVATPNSALSPVSASMPSASSSPVTSMKQPKQPRRSATHTHKRIPSNISPLPGAVGTPSLDNITEKTNEKKPIEDSYR